MKLKMNTLPVFFLLACLFCPAQAPGQSCNKSIASTTPDSSFVLGNDGTVTDRSTGLIWMRCSLGQVWNGKTCERGAAVHDWGGALRAAESFEFAGFSDWRLPNKNELESIVEERCFSPAVNAEAFPATPADFFWSSSPFAGSSNGAWSVDFGFGAVNASVKTGKLHVRLVRGGR